jgi:DNA polymerase-1
MTINHKSYKDLLIPASNKLADIELNGIKVDQNFLEKKDKEYQKKLENIENNIREHIKEQGYSVQLYNNNSSAKADIDKFNPRSPKQCMFVAFDVLNLPKHNGRESSDEAALKYWRDEHNSKFAEMLLNYRQEHKTYSQYIDGMYKHIEDDGRIRGNFLLHGTMTGRLSSREPNLQNIQRSIREIFVPKEDHVFLEADYSQAELRTLAVESQDPFMLEVYQGGGDLHDAMAERIIGEDYTYEERVLVKTINFAILYGAGPHKISDRAGVSLDRAKELIDYWKNTAEVAWQWLQGQFETMKEQGYVETRFERRRRIPLIMNSNLSNVRNESMNSPIQGTASDLLMGATIELCEQGYTDTILALIHDSDLFELHKNTHKNDTREILEIMEYKAQDMMDADIPFEADAELSRESWGACKEIPKDDSGNLQFGEVDY